MLLTVVIVGVAVCFLIVKLSATASGTKERAQHRDRCVHCGARLKKLPGKAHFAGTCTRCGRTQPWAESVEKV